MYLFSSRCNFFEDEEKDDNSYYKIVGGCIGGIMCLIVVGGGGTILWCRKKEEKEQTIDIELGDQENEIQTLKTSQAILEKEKRDLADRMKKESELLEKYKKSNTELSVQKVSVESSYSDMTEKMKALSEDRNLLERQVIHLRVRKYV